MSTETSAAREETRQVGDVGLHLLRGGTGRPALVLHGIEGPEGWLDFHARLAGQAEVFAPSHPGFGTSLRPDWVESITDMARFYEWFLRDAGIDQVDLIGFGIGGWVAAEMATMCSHNLAHLVLVAPAGLRPSEGAAMDIFVLRWREVIEASVHDPGSSEFRRVYEASPIVDFGGTREAGRSMTMRMCYRPYMYSPSLAGAVGGVRSPTLIVWGKEDRIIPAGTAGQWQSRIPGARLELLDGCGHWPHFDMPERLAEVISRFISS